VKGRARLHVQLAAALLLAWSACERGSQAPARPAAAQVATAIVFVSANAAESPEADGSPSRPFASLQQALSRAPSGALLRLGPGTYQGPFVVPRPVVLSGAGSEDTRLTSPLEARAPVIASDGNALELRDLAVEGSAIGIAVARTSLR